MIIFLYSMFALWAVGKLVNPFLFGEEKMETRYNAKEWLIELISGGVLWYIVFSLIK